MLHVTGGPQMESAVAPDEMGTGLSGGDVAPRASFRSRAVVAGGEQSLYVSVGIQCGIHFPVGAEERKLHFAPEAQRGCCSPHEA